VIFLVDASASMGVKDTRNGESRFNYAKEIVDEVISGLRGDNVALWAFTSEPTMLSPLTLDYLFVRLRLRQMSINAGNIPGTSFDNALAKLRKEYFSNISPRHRTLVILSDGGDTQLEGMSGEQKSKEIANITNLVKNADVLNLHVYTVGLGTKEGGTVPDVAFEGKPVTSHLDNQLLIELAKRGRGDYYFANEMNTVEIARRLISKIEKESSFETVHKQELSMLGGDDLIYDLYFQVPLAIAILFLLIAIFLPDTRRKRVS
jgi:Ca-activated chloride channel family protein